ncbi:MAG: hypothetical protein WBG38_00495, partial [Nodosilinea sp.]
GRSVISPNGASNVIPRTEGAATFPATTTGDIAPIQPGLVQPGDAQRPARDADLDSIPALW